MNEMRAAVIDAPHSVSIVTMNQPTFCQDDVFIDVSYVGLCGTDLELLHDTSSYLTSGRTSFPHHFGHEWVGSVQRTGSNVRDLACGDVVTGSTMLFCQSCPSCDSGRRNQCSDLREVGLYGHAGAAAQVLVMPRRAVVSLGRGRPQPEHVLIEPLVTVLEAVDAASTTPGDRVLVIGAGTIGSLATAVLSHCPLTVEVLEPRSVDHLRPGAFTRSHIDSSTLTDPYDVVVEASGAPGALQTAITALRPGGKCILVGVSPRSEAIDPGAVALAGISIIGVRHGVDHYRRAAGLFGLLEPDLSALIDSVIPLADAEDAFERLESSRVRPKVVISID